MSMSEEVFEKLMDDERFAESIRYLAGIPVVELTDLFPKVPMCSEITPKGETQ
jgi:hypothetical protein